LPLQKGQTSLLGKVQVKLCLESWHIKALANEPNPDQTYAEVRSTVISSEWSYAAAGAATYSAL
jgi:hypothetical protein